MSPPSCPTGPRQRRPKPPPDVLNILASVRRARCTGDLSPAAGLLAWYGWALHLSLSPGKQRSPIEKGLHKQRRFARHVAARCEQPWLPHVHRAIGAGSALRGAGLAIAPFKVIHQGFPLQQQWRHNATTGVRGVPRHHESMATSAGRQWLDMLSPSNFARANPELPDAIKAGSDANLRQGAMDHFSRRTCRQKSPDRPIQARAIWSS